MAWKPGNWQRAGGARSDQTLCRTVPAGPGTPGWELSERSRAHRLRVSAWLPLSFSALPCLQLSLGAMLSPLPASFSLRRAVLPSASSAPASRAGCPPGRAGSSPPFTGPLIRAEKQEQCPQAAAAEASARNTEAAILCPRRKFLLDQAQPEATSARPSPAPALALPVLPFTPLSSPEFTAPGCPLLQVPSHYFPAREVGGIAGTVALGSHRGTPAVPRGSLHSTEQRSPRHREGALPSPDLLSCSSTSLIPPGQRKCMWSVKVTIPGSGGSLNPGAGGVAVTALGPWR